MLKKLKIALAAAILICGLTATSAKADSLSISLSQSFGIADSQIISVKVNNLPTGKGVYVRECYLINGAPSSDPNDCTKQQNVGSSLWIGPGRGASDPSQSQPFKVLRTINGKDCAPANCAIMAMRDHVDFSDRSLDTLIPIKVSNLTITASRATNFVDAGEVFTITINGLATNQGVYVRECAISDVTARPTNCDNANAVWASVWPAALGMGGVDASKPVPFKVWGEFKGSKGNVDCQLVTCGIYIERDFNGLSDRSLDTLQLIAFSSPVKKSQTVAKWSTKPSTFRLIKGRSTELAKLPLVTNRGEVLTWAVNNSRLCSITATAKNVYVKGLAAGDCVVTATAAENLRGARTTFAWTVKVSK